MESKTVKLSNPQCKELDEVITSLVEKYKTEYIFCFSCLNDTKTANSCFVEEVKQSNTHYFLLMITTEITRIEHEVQDYVNRFFETANIQLLFTALIRLQMQYFKAVVFFPQLAAMDCSFIQPVDYA